MLSKFLFVGLGGSGGKTLQFLHQNLELRLKAIDKKMPKAWQFLWLDVPTVPDLLDPGSGVKPLPNKYYQSLAGEGLNYNVIDSALIDNKGGELYEEMAQWSPDPSRVSVPIQLGAGQYRAIGRVVSMSRYEEIGRKIDLSLNALEGAGTDEELKDIARALNLEIEDGADVRRPQVVIVCSLAGGSGAGSIVDVADIIRAKVTNNESFDDNSVGILYTPDVFEGQVENVGIEANSIFALSEIINGSFDSTPGERPESELLPQFGIEKPDDTRRGPRYNFLVGKSNGKVTFDSPQDIFRNTGRLLSAWCLDPEITNEIAFDVLGNWTQKCESEPNNTTGLFHYVSTANSPNYRHPYALNSMGYSSVGLGREYFREYVAQRISKKVIKHIARAHYDDDVLSGKKSVNQALEEKTTALFGHFLSNSGLDEIGTERNDLTEVIRSPNNSSNLDKYAQDIINFATEGKEDQRVSSWIVDVTDSYNYYISKFSSIELQEQKEQARKWTSTFEKYFVDHVINTVSEAGTGAPVTIRLIEILEQELQKTLEDLKNERQEFSHWSTLYKNTFSEVLEELGDNTKIKPDNEIWDTLRIRIREPLFWTSEITVRTITIELIEEFLRGVIPGILKVLRDISDQAEMALDPSTTEGKEVALWAEESVTDALKPSENEILIESWKEYEQKYEEILKLVYKDQNAESTPQAETYLIKDILCSNFKGSDESENLILVNKNWVPENTEYKDRSTPPQYGDYESTADLFEIKSRVESFVVHKEGDFGRYIDQPLEDYLSETHSGSVRELSDRTDKFIAALAKALDMARPQITVEKAFHNKVHKTKANLQVVVSAIPFTNEKVKSRVIETILPYFDNNQDDVSGLFKTSPSAKSIQFFAVYEFAKDVTVFKSLWDSLMRSWFQNKENPTSLSGMWQWRRSRQLLHTIPLQQEVINTMINGFFTARLMDQIKVERDGNSQKVEIYSKKLNKYVKFPEPLVTPNPQPSDLLAAILLSVPLAMGIYSFNTDDEALAPYQRLIELGTDGSGNIGSYTNLNQELETFIKNGSIEETTSKLSKWKNNYFALRKDSLVVNGSYDRYPSLGWEIGIRVADIISNLMSSVENLKTQNQDDF